MISTVNFGVTKVVMILPVNSGIAKTRVLIILPVLRAWNHCPQPSPGQTWLSVEASPSLGYSLPG